MTKNALITGASKRIGRAVANYLAETGWNIAIHYNTSKDPANELNRELSLNFPNQKFFTVKANLFNKQETETLIGKVVIKLGSLNLLINNASVFNQGYIKETSLELFESQMDINLKASFVLIRDFARNCAEGNIINFVDTRITTNKSNFAAYSLSKKGLWELTKMAALEFAPAIRVNAIAPGVTLPPEDKDESYLQNLAKMIPMKEPGGVNPILLNIKYILENNQLTGQLLFADGGENLGRNE